MYESKSTSEYVEVRVVESEDERAWLGESSEYESQWVYIYMWGIGVDMSLSVGVDICTWVWEWMWKWMWKWECVFVCVYERATETETVIRMFLLVVERIEVSFIQNSRKLVI